MFSKTVEIYNMTSGVWRTAELSRGRSGVATTSVGDRFVLFAGGLTGTWDNRVASAAVDIYNVDTNTWTTAALSHPRVNIAATSAGELAFFAGGSSGDESLHSVIDVYNATSGAWSTLSLSESRTLLGAVSLGDLVFFAGGYRSGAYTSLVEIYNTTSRVWASPAHLSQPQTISAAFAMGSKAFFLGRSVTNFVARSALHIYDACTGAWTAVAVPRLSYETATAANGLVILAGTLVGYETAGTVDIYTVATGAWTSASLSVARRHLAAASAGNASLLAGGDLNTATVSDAIDVYRSAYLPPPGCL